MEQVVQDESWIAWGYTKMAMEDADTKVEYREEINATQAMMREDVDVDGGNHRVTKRCKFVPDPRP